jgi:hypothetical protein
MRALADVVIGMVSAGALLATLCMVARVRLARDRLSFRCRTAQPAWRWWHRDGMHWRFMRTRASWINDVLLIRGGLLGTRTLAIPAVLDKDARIEPEMRTMVRRLGRRPQSLWIEGSRSGPVKVAVREEDRAKLAGPFLVAAIAGLPAAPRRNRRRTP